MRGSAIKPVCYDVAEAGVPVAQILNARAEFGAGALTFEILLDAREPISGLRACTELAAMGLPLASLSYREAGCIFVRLRDNGAVDPFALSRHFAGHNGVSVQRWTNVVTFQDARQA